MATPEQVAQAHYRRQKQISAAAVAGAVQQWNRLDEGSLTESWLARIGRLILALITQAQRSAAEEANPYLGELAAAQGAALSGSALVVADAFAGIASDGRPLESLLYWPIIQVKRWIADGRRVPEAMAHGRSVMALIAATQVADAGRAAVSAGMTADKTWVSYVRHVTLPACSRCIILAGREYSYSTGFLRHPNCFPAGVAVSGPAARAATRRWYEGELVVVTTASGQELPITGNHPVLTNCGWVPANLLEPGDYVIRSVLAEGAVPLVVPDERQMPTLIEDLWRPDGMSLLVRMPTTAEDFHGDGGYGEVDVVLADRFLGDRLVASIAEPVPHGLFSGAVASANAFDPGRAVEQLLVRVGAASDGVVRGGGLTGALFGGHLGGADLACRGHVANGDALLFQSRTDNVAAHLVAQAEAVLALAGDIRGRDLGVGERDSLSSRWDALGVYGSVENRLGYACRGSDLLGRLTGQVELDRVVDVRRVDWCGHVFNLTSTEGWYAANSLIVSNCDCTMIPVRHDSDRSSITSPRELFDQLSPEEQDKAFTKAGAEAIRLGSDLGQIVNARRGMQTVGGRLVTSEGTTRRGQSGRRMGATGSHKTAVRPMPEQILKDSGGDREEAVRLLQRFGYISASPPSPGRSSARDGRGSNGSARAESGAGQAGGGQPPVIRPEGGGPGDEPERPHLDTLIPREDDEAVARQMEIQQVFGRMWGRQFGGMTVRVTQVEAQKDEITVFGQVMDGSTLLGEVIRAYHRQNDGALWVAIDLQELFDVGRQGGGFGAAFNLAEEDWYRASGVDRIELLASMTVGGYAWARAGFDFLNQGEAEGVWQRLELELDQLEQWLNAHQDDDAVSGEEYEQSEDDYAAGERLLRRAYDGVFGSSTYPTPAEVARLGWRPGMGRDDRWLGKRVLLGSSWRGVKYL